MTDDHAAAGGNKGTVVLVHGLWLSSRSWEHWIARYHVPAPGRPLFQAATANLLPGAATKVNFRNANRAPLLLVAGGADHTVPPSLVRENLKRYRKSSAVTVFQEYPGRSHFTAGSPGWEQVADFALSWAERHRAAAPTQP